MKERCYSPTRPFTIGYLPAGSPMSCLRVKNTNLTKHFATPLVLSGALARKKDRVMLMNERWSVQAGMCLLNQKDIAPMGIIILKLFSMFNEIVEYLGVMRENMTGGSVNGWSFYE